MGACVWVGEREDEKMETYLKRQADILTDDERYREEHQVMRWIEEQRVREERGVWVRVCGWERERG